MCRCPGIGSPRSETSPVCRGGTRPPVDTPSRAAWRFAHHSMGAGAGAAEEEWVGKGRGDYHFTDSTL